ncbi:hypothetical protein BTK96_000834 [Burkholderia pyrrocinia]|nr:hypothetical protein [Burkholderia pyrrocinia]EKS9893605.1 hypothetical protein [Burkholderia pyrrocinia]EKS9905777.1 hypothetical protein [Burkholderia pyrrocinia]
MEHAEDKSLKKRFVFKLKCRNAVFVVLLLAMIIITATIGVLAFSNKKISVPFAILFPILIIFSVIIIVNIIANVEVGDDGIHRVLFGVEYQSLSWDNISKITSFPVSGRAGESVRALNIFPLKKPAFRLTPSGKIFFSERFVNFDELIKIINQYVRQYNIRVEVREAPLGKVIVVDKL